ncbi:Flagellar biosynthesis protein FlhF [Paenibacillus nuruki]|uniref:Flagellar biosynthesis protein FlhF n=1 Tax=Paenibacillus nuruki TaxID=1886670 RepID=A0A1E3L4X8_9BACL|nr:flagellar biosynthesis protein FlhF [Paenibacillus nuruki]ODP28651.1 Flagellar biosynthesis protein FlhF [Paenibacillus nuruki]
MRVKRYIVDTMPDAMLKIRTDLGSDAVILSTKELKTGGFLGMFQKKKIEVIAAVEKEQAAEPVKAQPEINIPAAVPKRVVPDAYRKSSEAFAESMRQALAGEPTDSAEGNSVASTPFSAPLEPSISDQAQSSLRHVPFVAEQPVYKAPESNGASQSDQQDKLFEELREMKKMMADLSREKEMATLPTSLVEIADRLKKQGLDQELLDSWLSEAMGQFPAPELITNVDAKAAMKFQIEQFTQSRIGGGIDPATKIVYVAGPTGVGKTTTIAKLAAEQLFKYKRKVGLITSDTYRISAVEQLRTYASILGVPLEVVQSPGDLQRSLQRLDECDLILMDTAGRNYRNELLVSELQSLLAPLENSETYLVLSFTSKTEDMRTITEHFSKYPLDKVIFTKADETGSYGALFNLLQEYPLRLSYMTNGQNVPDDLLMPSPDFLANLLLGDILP